MIGLEFEIEGDGMKTPRTDKSVFTVVDTTAKFSATVSEVVGAEFARQLERENENLRRLLDKASRALACFIDLRGMTAAELKSAHNGICILLEKTRMLDEIKAGVEDGEK
jgi:hypothetical protein